MLSKKTGVAQDVQQPQFVEQLHTVEQRQSVEQPKDVEHATRCGTKERSAIRGIFWLLMKMTEKAWPWFILTYASFRINLKFVHSSLTVNAAHFEGKHMLTHCLLC